MRKRANKRYDRKVFTSTAARTNKRNVNRPPMRGGYRL